MSRNGVNAKGRRTEGRYFGLPHALMRHENYTRLSAHAVRLLNDLGLQYNGYNNGDLQATWSFMSKRGWKSKATLHRAIKELRDRWWILVARQGGRHKATLYALSFLAIDECDGKLEIAATRSPPSTWKNDFRAPNVYQLSTEPVPIREMN